MIHRIKEGQRMRWGLNVGKGYIGVWLSRRFYFWVDPRTENKVSGCIDFRQDHRMYRPNDADEPYLFCRRCGLSSFEAKNFCSGKVLWRKR